jgi:CPA1 family monovalent cation:H+ antiporter
MEKWGYREAHDQEILPPKTFDRLDLMVDLKNDAVAAGRMPPPVLNSETLERRFEKGLFKLLGWPWSQNGREPRHLDQVLQQHYEFDLAVAFIGQKVAAQVQQLGQQLAGRLDPATFEACAAWYAAMSQERLTRLKAAEKARPELFQAIQQYVLKQAVQVSARQRLAKLLADGIVSSTIVEKLSEGLEFD